MPDILPFDHPDRCPHIAETDRGHARGERCILRAGHDNGRHSEPYLCGIRWAPSLEAPLRACTRPEGHQGGHETRGETPE